MAILIDQPRWPAHNTFFSHLISDRDLDELHTFARTLGLPRRSFDLDHYDVAISYYERAITLGAKAATARDIVFALQDSGLRVRASERDAVRPERRIEYLHHEWRLLGEVLDRRITFVNPVSASASWHTLGTELLARWGEPHRRYHNHHHLEDVLLALDHLSLRGETVQHDTLIAAWFHDAVYAGQPTDETESARFAVQKLGEVFSEVMSDGGSAGQRGQGGESELVARVAELIVATAPAGAAPAGTATAGADSAGRAGRAGRAGSAADAGLAQLLDADLAIFAAPTSRYDDYRASVRHEYQHIAEEQFREGRARILSAYATKPSIYRTATAQKLWEEHARENLSRELEALQG